MSENNLPLKDVQNRGINGKNVPSYPLDGNDTKNENSLTNTVTEVVQEVKKKLSTPPAPVKSQDPSPPALVKSQDLMHQFNIKTKHESVCIGYFNTKNGDSVLAACAARDKEPSTCPVTFDPKTCVKLHPVKTSVVKNATVKMF